MMKNKNLIMLSLLATLLLSTTLASFANAADEVTPSSIEPAEPITAVPPDSLGDAPKSEPLSEPTLPDEPVSPGDEILYTIRDDDSVTAKDFQAPGAEEANLISARTDGANANEVWVVLGIMAVLAVGLGSVLGVVLYRRVPIKN